MGLDSVELVLALEGEFGVEIPEAAAERMRTPRDVIEWLVAARLGLLREAVAESVRRIVIEQLGIRPDDYREDGRFVEDFGMD